MYVCTWFACVCSAGANTKWLATRSSGASYGNPLTPTHGQNKHTRWTVHRLSWGFKQYPITTQYTESIGGSVVVMVVWHSKLNAQMLVCDGKLTLWCVIATACVIWSLKKIGWWCHLTSHHMDQSNCWNCRKTVLAVRSTCIPCVCNWIRPSLTTSHKQDAPSLSSLQLLSPVANGGLGQESLSPTTGTHTHMYTHTHARKHARTHACTYARMHARTHTQYMQNDVPPPPL